MLNDNVRFQAQQLRYLIESGRHSSGDVSNGIQTMVSSLGGTAIVIDMPLELAVAYLLSLILTNP